MFARTLLLILFLAPIHSGMAKDGTETLELPPASLAQWYKPANKRQVWLHTMFGLRREMQAVREYAEKQDAERVAKWLAKFAGHYRKIPEMVPEWQQAVDLGALERLEMAAKQADYAAITHELNEIGSTCNNCHRDYRAIAAVMYRAPDFDFTTVTSGEGAVERDFAVVMQELSTLINRIKIAADDQRPADALAALHSLDRELTSLGGTCDSCHPDKRQQDYLLGERRKDAVSSLEQALNSGDAKQSGSTLGTLAVEVCATCHGIHRTSSDLRSYFGR